MKKKLYSKEGLPQINCEKRQFKKKKNFNKCYVTGNPEIPPLLCKIDLSSGRMFWLVSVGFMTLVYMTV